MCIYHHSMIHISYPCHIHVISMSYPCHSSNRCHLPCQFRALDKGCQAGKIKMISAKGHQETTHLIHGLMGLKGKSNDWMELQRNKTWNNLKHPETKSATCIHCDPLHFSACLHWLRIQTRWLESWWTSKFLAKLMYIQPIQQIRHVWSWECRRHPN